MNNDQQLNFDFGLSEKEPEKPEVQPVAVKSEIKVNEAPVEKKNPVPAEKTEVQKLKKLKPLDMKRAVLGWLLPQHADGVALGVPTRVKRFHADIAAFWSAPAQKRLLLPWKTMIVELRSSREHCWPDCARQEELLPLLRKSKQLKGVLEEQIRKDEPHLKESDNLFSEYVSWNYRASANREYRRCLKHIEEIEHALYKGSRFEQIRRGHVADYLYLAVPAGTVYADELADGWGLINIHPDMSCELVRTAESWECPVENKLHLAQQIAASCREKLFFAYGVAASPKSAAPVFLPLPKKRRVSKYI